ncbi:MAG: sulfotransferase, partial [Myxococcota bacterium]|nr:sulfotransferase [Myxococcota bacterium]
MTLQVIGAGFGRTGTASLKRALEILGLGPCYHMFEIRRAPWKARAWLPVIRGGAPDWTGIYRGYASAVDWPTCSFHVQLAEAFPQARFVLTTRDPERWYQSTHRTLYALWQAMPGWVRWLPLVGSIHALIVEHIWDGTFEGRFGEQAEALSRYQAHQAAVVASLPEERLLVFGVEQGWEPLCSFLEVPVPDVPFPHLN